MMIKLTAIKREVFGKDLQAIRKTGKLPIAVYGAKEKANSYFVETIDFKKVLKEAGESTIVSLTTPGGVKETLIHEISYDPMTREPIHADFLAVETNKPVQVYVPLTFIGEAPAVKTLSAMVVKVMHELEIEALPKDLPHEIEVDLSSLVDLDSQIKVGDIVLPVGVTTDVDVDEVVVSVTEAGEEIEEENATVDLSAIEVEKKGKEEVE